VDSADADRRIEEIAKQLHDAPIRAVANEHQAQNQLVGPVLGDRQVKQYIVITWGRCKGFIQGLLRFVALLIHELSTDLMLGGQVADGLRARKYLNANVLADCGRQAGGDGKELTHIWRSR
jgi:hypothetical protein